MYSLILHTLRARYQDFFTLRLSSFLCFEFPYFTEVFVDQKRINICEHTVKMMPHDSFNQSSACIVVFRPTVHLWQSNEQFVCSNTSTPAVVGEADWCASGKLLGVDLHLDLFCCYLRGQLPVV